MATKGPTRGATEVPDSWQASPALAVAVRLAVVLIPLVGAFLILRLTSHMLYRPAGKAGFALWVAQALVVGTASSIILDRMASRLLPLATICNMSLVFPDQAPSRFGTALRSGSVRNLEKRLEETRTKGLGATEAEAAATALELVTLLSRHDRLTRGHTERVRAYADIIAAEMGLSDHDRSRLAWGVLLHDIGKITVPSEVLNKVEKLTDDEWQLLRGHPAASGELLTPLSDWLGVWKGAATEHHERWDGNGYPNGLAGADISLAGRITAVADAYDVITTKRSYKAPMSVAAARRELVDCAGGQFDPSVVRAFLNVSLGHRWLAGPLAAVSHLPFGNLTAAPAIVTAGTMAAVGTVAVIAPPLPAQELAYTEPAEVVVAEAAPAPEPDVARDIEPPGESLQAVTPVTEPNSESPAELVSSTTTLDLPGTTATTDEPTTTTTAPTTTALSTSTTAAPATTTAPTTTTTATTAAPTTTTTAPATTTAPTTAAPTTTATPTTTTTTAAPTTTTTAPTTTTTAPAPVLLHLGNPGVGDSAAQLFKTLKMSGPDDTSQPNFDTDRDAIAGLRLAPTENGFGEWFSTKIGRWGIDVNALTMTGSPTLSLYVATDADGVSAVMTAELARCDSTYLACTTISPAVLAPVNTYVGDGFEELTFNFANPNVFFDTPDRLVVRVITEGSEVVHVAFDSDLYPSRLSNSVFQ